MSLLFAKRSSTVTTAYNKETMIISTHILRLSSLRCKGLHFLLPMYSIHILLNRDFFHEQFFSLVWPLRNHVTLLLSHQSFPRANCTNLHISRTWDTSPLERALNIKVSLTSSLVLPTSSPSLHKMRKYFLTIDYLDVSKTKVKSIITSLAQTQMLN